ncbi:unnamed protein product, partial [Ectocarpus sp. 4 AP-2014]
MSASLRLFPTAGIGSPMGVSGGCQKSETPNKVHLFLVVLVGLGKHAPVMGSTSAGSCGFRAQKPSVECSHVSLTWRRLHRTPKNRFICHLPLIAFVNRAISNLRSLTGSTRACCCDTIVGARR